MKNGDRLTCEVKSLVDGVLKVDLDYVDGSISLNWLKVDHLESNALFLVQLQDGTIYSARMLGAKSPAGNVGLQPEEQQPLFVDKASIVRMTQTSAKIGQRFNGDINFGFGYTKGNSTTQYNFGSELGYRESRWGAKLTYSSNLSASTGATTSTRNQADLIAYRMLRWTNYFYAGTGEYLQSSVQGIRRQTQVGVGLGRFLKNTNRIRLPLMVGVGWQRTDYVPAAQTQQQQDIAVGFIAANLEAFSFKKSRVRVNGSVAPALTEGGRIFSRINTTYYVKVFGKIDWNLSFYGNWDTRPPAHLPRSDYGTSTGLSWTFGNTW